MIDHPDPASVPPGAGLIGEGRGPEALSDVVARRLLAQRVVILHGPLDDFSVTRVSAELMTLDAGGDEPVTLRVDCGEAQLATALTLMDVIELMGVPVRRALPGPGGWWSRRRGGCVQPPFLSSEHTLLPVRANDPVGGPRSQRHPMGRAARRREDALLRPSRPGHRSGPDRGGARPAAGALPQRGRGVGVRDPRRGGPPRGADSAIARNWSTAHGVPPAALTARTRPGPSSVPTMRP